MTMVLDTETPESSMTPERSMTPDELLTTTRSVRRRLNLSEAVDLALVKECIEIALQAPNGGNRQRWGWVVVADAGLRAEIGTVYRRAFERRYPPNLDLGDEALPEARTVHSGRYLATHLHEVPVLVIPCLRVPDGLLPEGNQAGLWGSLLPATWSYMLAARARGLGTAWTSVHLDAEQEVADLLGLPDGVRQGALIPTAHVLGTGFRRGARIPVKSVLHLDGWAEGGWDA